MQAVPPALPGALPRRSIRIRLRRTLHRWADPALSQPNRRRAARLLRGLPDGEHCVPVGVPYAAQFATPALIRAYIHDGLDGAQDPNRAAFGADRVDPAEYTFWAHRACAVACVKMAIDAFRSEPPASMWQLIQDGLALGGYRVHNERGIFVDQGWFYPALAELAARNGLETRGMAYASTLDVCAALRDGWIVAAAVTPELGEHGPLRRYDGHFVIVYGFVWRRHRPEHFLVHNPSGRYEDLQAGARIPAGRFGRAFAHRFIALRRKVKESNMTTNRQNISSGTTWEGSVGYSRAVRIGNWISVAGTTAADERSQPVGVGDPYAQTVYILRKIERALKEAGATLEDVIRTRVFIVRTEDWEQVGRAHGEFFSAIRPASTMVTVKELIGPEYLVEIEVDAVVQG